MTLGGTLLRFLLVVTCVLTSFSICEARAAGAGATTWGHARIVERDGHSIFEVDGKPFFLYGAAFFYERLPRDQWETSMSRLAEMGINTLDIYVPWNWHELSDGDFDFDGRTSPRRDFDDVLRLAKKFDFKIVLRPGPVVRNEWRNGGYPAWLLERPEYGMPLHDVLEGRYPATATLQNQHSDDAAAEWMRNATHVKYAKRWLERVLAESSPYADRILAVALDDDQGAYIDNQTYPAPHFKAYIEWLRDTIHAVTGNDELTFINTYQMKVPASSPVWAMGNWYQSDAYAIGEHDESQLAFTFAQIATRPSQPLFASEFQAGWLQGAGEAMPRAADPSNTELAMATMFGAGVRGLVNFPAQDTLDPTGWEAPFANFAYAWDAAIRLDNGYAPRSIPTAEMGALVKTLGPELATSFPRFDASIAYVGSLVPPAVSGGTTFSQIASATIDAQKACVAAGFACNLVDVARGHLTKHDVLIIPSFDDATRNAIGNALGSRLAMLVSRGIDVRRLGAAVDVRSALARRKPIVENVDDAVFSESTGGNVVGFLSVANYSSTDRVYARSYVRTSSGKRITLPPFAVRAHHAIISPIGLDLPKTFTHGDMATGDMLNFTDCMPIGWHGRGDILALDFHSFEQDFQEPGAVGKRDSCTLDVSSSGRSRILEIDRTRMRAELDVRTHTLEAPAMARDAHEVTDSGDIPIPLQLRPGFTFLGEGTAYRIASPGDEHRHVRLDDIFREGVPSADFQNDAMRLIVSPNAGARSFFFETNDTGGNWFTTVGGLRDDVAIEPPLSTTDRIAKYTHDFPAGTFNRPYATSDVTNDSATFEYTAPDVIPSGATFTKTISLTHGPLPGFDLDELADFAGAPVDTNQRAVSVTSFATDPLHPDATQIYAPGPSPVVAGTSLTVSGRAFAIVRGNDAIIVAYSPAIEKTELSERTGSIVARMTIASGARAHVLYRVCACGANAASLVPQMLVAETEAMLPQPQVTTSPGRIP